MGATQVNVWDSIGFNEGVCLGVLDISEHTNARFSTGLGNTVLGCRDNIILSYSSTSKDSCFFKSSCSPGPFGSVDRTSACRPGPG